MARSPQDVYSSEPHLLARLLDIDGGAERVWRPEELGAILRHQLAAPLTFDLGALGAGVVEKLETVRATEELPVKSFADLLQHPHPPVELLVLTKEFAKAMGVHPDSPVPADVARVLYFASITAALIRCGRRITRLDDAALRHGIRWAAEREWVDEDTRSLLRDGLRLFESGESVASE